MSKKEYSVRIVKKHECVSLLQEHHYLTGISKGFKSGFNVGLFKEDDLVGVCIFTGFPVPELVVGLFGLSRDSQEGMWELSRLVLAPDVQALEHNLASWFVAKSIKRLRKSCDVRAILSYADEGYHKGTVYRALGFDYYGLSAQKKDFWVKTKEGVFKKMSRGKTKGVDGEWRLRTRKHRFLKVYDKTLNPLWAKAEENK